MEIDTPIIQLFTVLFIASAIHGLFLFFIVLNKPSRSTSNKWIAILLLLTSAWMGNYLLYTSGWITHLPHALNAAIPFLYLIGPILYFETKSIICKSYKLSGYDFLHFIPFIYILISNIPLFLEPGHVKLEIINAIMEGNEPASVLKYMEGNLLNIYTLIYGIISYWVLTKSQIKNSPFIALTRVLILVLNLMIVLPFVFMLLDINPVNIELTMVFLLGVILHMAGYLVLNNPTVKTEKAVRESRYSTSPLSAEQIGIYKESLYQIFNLKKPWKNPQFKIEDLAFMLNIPKHHVSHVLNEGVGKNFYELVNEYRINAVLERLSKGDHERFSISGIGADCGFNSTSTFHRAFKKVTGKTPTSYIKSIIHSSSV